MLYLGDVQSYFLAYQMFYSKSKMVLIGWIQAVSGVVRIIMPFTARLAWRVGAEFVLHPLIHTIPSAASTQNMEVRSK
jgi:hypothetical protein